MDLEQQLAKLADLGLKLNDGITVDDMLHSYGRDEYETQPFDLILFVFGIEVERPPWNRRFCSRVWNFDSECIEETGDYTEIVKRLCEVAGRPDYLKSISDFVDIDAGKAWLKYEVNGVRREWNVEVNDDWADPTTIAHVMEDLEYDDHRFFYVDNGQSMILFFLDPPTATELNRLTNDGLTPVLS